MGKRRKRNCTHLLTLLQAAKRLKSCDSNDNCIVHSDYEYEETHFKHTYPNILRDMQELTIMDPISLHIKPLPRDGIYKNWQHYLSLHFSLLREDFIAPLRKGISEYKINGIDDKDKSDIRVYDQAIFSNVARIFWKGV